MAPTLFFRTALAGAVVLCAVAPMGLACGSIDCTETLTCPGLGNDATADAQDASVAGDDASSGSEAAPSEGASLEGGDDGTGDSTVTPAADATVDTMNAAAAEGSADGMSDAGADGPTIPMEGAADGAPVPCSCVAAPPAGWIGPVVAIEQIVDSDAPIPPPCPPPYPMVAFPFFADPSDAAVACACACEGPCTLQVSAYASGACDAGPSCATATVSGGCVSLGDGCVARAAEISSPAALTGCEVTATKNAPPEWGTIGSVCGSGKASLPPGACEAGQICAPTLASTSRPTMCIYKDQLMTCPTSYPSLHTYFSNAADTRGCDARACSCSGPDSGTCGAPAVTLSSAADCANAATVAALTSACSAPFPATPSLYVGATIPTSAGSCIASGDASPVGAVTPGEGDTLLLCCTD